MKPFFIVAAGLMTLISPDMSAQTAPTPRHFWHEDVTTASPDTIWRIWTDVAHWHIWDSGLKTASLEGAFVPGTRGTLTPDQGGIAKFELVAVDPGRSYTFRTALPLGGLYITRTLWVQEGQTWFRHEVEFRGLTRGLFAWVLGRRYQTLLPGVMAEIRRLSEQP